MRLCRTVSRKIRAGYANNTSRAWSTNFPSARTADLGRRWAARSIDAAIGVEFQNRRGSDLVSAPILQAIRDGSRSNHFIAGR
jgi:hypothetical protein